jgi:hypothetical protein
MQEAELQLFFTGVLSAISVKLTSSVDDVLWLAPFLTTNTSSKIRLQNALVYVTVCMIQTVVALVIAGSGSAAVSALTAGNKDAWSTDKILTVSAGVLLAIYTVKLTYEYIYDQGDDDEDGTPADATAELEMGQHNESEADVKKFKADSYEKLAVTEPEVETQDSPKQTGSGRTISGLTALQKQTAAERKQQWALFVMAFVGSVDDLTLFVPLLVGKGFDFLQLMSGAAIASVTIVIICTSVGMCRPVANCLSSIPLALIVASFATILLVRGYFVK